MLLNKQSNSWWFEMQWRLVNIGLGNGVLFNTNWLSTGPSEKKNVSKGKILLFKKMSLQMLSAEYQPWVSLKVLIS